MLHSAQQTAHSKYYDLTRYRKNDPADRAHRLPGAISVYNEEFRKLDGDDAAGAVERTLSPPEDSFVRCGYDSDMLYRMAETAWFHVHL